MLLRNSRRHLQVEQLESRDLLTGLGSQVADFALLDVNPTSATYNTMVSPRDYQGQVSAWYFGYSS